MHDDLNRQFIAARPYEPWLTDITEHPTGEGKLYLCAIEVRLLRADHRLLYAVADEVRPGGRRAAQRDSRCAPRPGPCCLRSRQPVPLPRPRPHVGADNRVIAADLVSCAGGWTVRFGIWLHEDLMIGHCQWSCYEWSI